MHNLLVVTAVLEGATGLVLMTLPSRLATLLLGSTLDEPAALTLARVAGVALAALAVTCWLARHDGQSRAARGLVGAMVHLPHGRRDCTRVREYRTLAIRHRPLAHCSVSRGHDRVVPHELALKIGGPRGAFRVPSEEPRGWMVCRIVRESRDRLRSRAESVGMSSMSGRWPRSRSESLQDHLRSVRLRSMAAAASIGWKAKRVRDFGRTIFHSRGVQAVRRRLLQVPVTKALPALSSTARVQGLRNPVRRVNHFCPLVG